MCYYQSKGTQRQISEFVLEKELLKYLSNITLEPRPGRKCSVLNWDGMELGLLSQQRQSVLMER